MPDILRLKALALEKKDTLHSRRIMLFMMTA